jgi:hypothetical protein
MFDIGEILRSLDASDQRPATIVSIGRGSPEDGFVVSQVLVETADRALIEVTAEVDVKAGAITRVDVRDLRSDTAIPLASASELRGNAADVLLTLGLENEPVWLP